MPILLSHLSDKQNTRGYELSKPVEMGKEYTVDISDTGRGGDGITRINGFVIFVRSAKAGDKNVKIKINSVGSRFANAVVVTGSSTDLT
jgi:predicted RNA-binding protein with TRAM domain